MKDSHSYAIQTPLWLIVGCVSPYIFLSVLAAICSGLCGILSLVTYYTERQTARPSTDAETHSEN